MSTSDGQLQDWLGHAITPGVKILYPGRRGASLWLTMAEVLEVNVVQDTWDHVNKWSLKVQPVKTTFYFGQSFDKPTTITALDRVTVIGECP